MAKGIPDLSDPSIGGEFTDYIGLRFTELSGDLVVATWTAGPHLHQPHGIVHGGVHSSVVETLASMGATVWLGEQGRVVGVNNNTDFYRAVSEGSLTSTATPLHRGQVAAGLGRRDGDRRRRQARLARPGAAAEPLPAGLSGRASAAVSRRRRTCSR